MSVGLSGARLALAVVLIYVIALVVMVGCAYLWVFLYSQLVYAGGDQAYYEAYASFASPVVAVAVAAPVYFCAGRYLLRFGAHAHKAALAILLLNVVMEGIVLTTITTDLSHHLLMSGFAMLGKLLGVYAGIRAG